jgi:hypothetical protein
MQPDQLRAAGLDEPAIARLVDLQHQIASGERSERRWPTRCHLGGLRWD